MARQQRSLRPIVELASHLSTGSWLALAVVAVLVLVEAGGLVLAILQLSFAALRWPGSWGGCGSSWLTPCCSSS